MGHGYTVSHAAVLASQLPPHARCWIKRNPDLAWSDERALLEAIDYHLRHLTWMLSEDGRKKQHKPKPPETPSQVADRAERIKHAQLNREKVDRMFGIHH